MKTVVIDRKRYTVTDDLGFQMGRGCWAVEVETSDGPCIATRDSLVGSKWKFAEQPVVMPKYPVCGQ